MIGILLLTCVGLLVWCGARSRRVGSTSTSCCVGADDGDRDGDVNEQLATLVESHQRMESELYDRVTELEERLDFTEQMLAQANARAQIGHA